MAVTKKTTVAKNKAAPKVEETETEETMVEENESLKLGRKDLAVKLREKVKAAGLAIPPAVSLAAVVAYEEAIMESLAEGHEVHLPGFGVFSAPLRAEAKRPNPQKPGEYVIVAAHRAPKLKVGVRLKRAVNPVEEGEEQSGDE